MTRRSLRSMPPRGAPAPAADIRAAPYQSEVTWGDGCPPVMAIGVATGGKPIMRKTTRAYAGAAGVVLLASMALTSSLGDANADTSSEQADGVHLRAHLNPLNNAGT